MLRSDLHLLKDIIPRSIHYVMTSASKRFSILAVDPIDSAVKLKLQKRFNVDEKLGLSKEEIIKIIVNYDALIGRTSTKIDKDIIEAAKKLRCIGVHATGWDHIDIEAATARGIAVLGYPQDKRNFEKDRLRGSFIGAAEHVLLCMLATAGNFYSTVAGMKAGRWDKYKFQGTELYGKTLGIIGLGRIGSLVAERAHAFGMQVVAYAPGLTSTEAKKRGATKVSFDTLLKHSDFITLHVPKTPETHQMIGAKEFKKMKRGSILINTARASIVDEKALIRALTNGTLRAAAIDVHEHPPHGVNRQLIQLPNVLPTPHIAGVSVEGLSRVSTYIAESVAQYLTNGTARGLINAKKQTK